MDLTSGEAIEFSKLNAEVVQPSKTGINPYYLGIKIYEDIEERYNNPDEEMKRRGVKPGSGQEKIFEVREIEMLFTYDGKSVHRKIYKLKGSRTSFGFAVFLSFEDPISRKKRHNQG